jgi:murein L,D-transpeptidase YcbB/YkuD
MPMVRWLSLCITVLFLAACAHRGAPGPSGRPADGVIIEWASDGVDVSGAIRALLERPPLPGKLSADPRFRGRLTAMYAKRDHAPLWLDNGLPTPRADAAVALLARAADEGLQPDHYRVVDLKSLQGSVRSGKATPDQKARLDVTLTFAMARFVSDVRVGRVSPATAGVAFDISPALAMVPGLIDRALGKEPLDTVVAAARPPVPLYQQLRKVLPRYRALAARDSGARLPAPAQSIKPGDSWAGVPALAARLALLGDHTGKPGKGTRYQGDLVNAVKRFQERHGLQVDGIIGGHTYSALAVPLSWRVRQMELSMERMRWMGLPDSHKQRIVVNLPQYRLWAFDAGSGPAELSMAVMVGEPDGNETPVMNEQITSIVFSPYWNVPFSITRDEILPKLRLDSQYLIKENMEMLAGGDVVEGPPDADDLAALAQGRYRLRQRPGPWNALGGVKFEFPNTHAIYMHDTPSRHLFSRSRRSLSHGCIRLQHPQALAAFLLADHGWDQARITAAMRSGSQERVRLREPVQVLLFYNTTMVSLEGRVAFLEDIYGLDRKLDAALRLAPP